MSTDIDASVKNASELLNRLMKDICSESASFTPREDVNDKKTRKNSNVKKFTMPSFILLLQERMSTLNPNVRLFLMNWLSILSSVPDLELISYFHYFLNDLFVYLNDPNTDGK